MEKLTKKELYQQYKDREVIGGIYCIKCHGNDHKWIKSTKDLQSAKKRFEFSIMINSCPEIIMDVDWKQYGASSFSFEVLEEMKKSETQTLREFSEDIAVLLEMWLEK